MKTERISVRVTPKLKKQLEDMAESLEMSPSDLVSSLVKGLCKTWQDDGEITIPYRVVPEKSYLNFLKSLPVIAISCGIGYLAYNNPQCTVQVGESLISMVSNFMSKA